jgi:hypothetical protein
MDEFESLSHTGGAHKTRIAKLIWIRSRLSPVQASHQRTPRPRRVILKAFATISIFSTADMVLDSA